MPEPNYLQSLNSDGYLAHVSRFAAAEDGLNLAQMVRTAPREVAKYLLQIDVPNLDPMSRKHMAFCLGQLGFDVVIPQLQTIARFDPAAGAKDAAKAGLEAIRLASADRFGTEDRRVEIIERVYGELSRHWA